MDWIVPLADLDYGWQEEEAVLRVIRSKWLTMGGITQEFEENFATFLNSPYAFAVSNATAGLHLACMALGIGPGDEVIVPSLTFVATSNAVLYTGATVIFADILGPDNLTIDPAEIDHLCTSRTKAVIAMHYGGYACHMPEIMAAAVRHNLAVIEDTAHAPGASLQEKSLGTWGDIGVFSFFSNKNLSTGEGGMVVTGRKDIADRLRLMRSHGMTALTYDRHKGHAHSYDVVALGYNYRIDELHSALGLAQLAKLVENNHWREDFSIEYRRILAGSEIKIPFAQTAGQPAYHLMPVLLPAWVKRMQVIDALKASGIQTSIHYPPIHTFSYYRERYGDISLPRTEAAAQRELTLPLYPTMGRENVNLVASNLLAVIEELREPS